MITLAFVVYRNVQVFTVLVLFCLFIPYVIVEVNHVSADLVFRPLNSSKLSIITSNKTCIPDNKECQHTSSCLWLTNILSLKQQLRNLWEGIQPKSCKNNPKTCLRVFYQLIYMLYCYALKSWAYGYVVIFIVAVSGVLRNKNWIIKCLDC